MEDMVLTGPDIDGVDGKEEIITCQRCGEAKARSEYRNVANPTICRQCYVTRRRERKQFQVLETTKETKGEDKQRVGVYLSPLALATLRALALQCKSDSAAVEALLLKAYGAMSPQEQTIVAYVQQHQK